MRTQLMTGFLVAAIVLTVASCSKNPSDDFQKAKPETAKNAVPTAILESDDKSIVDTTPIIKDEAIEETAAPVAMTAEPVAMTTTPAEVVTKAKSQPAAQKTAVKTKDSKKTPRKENKVSAPATADAATVGTAGATEAASDSVNTQQASNEQGSGAQLTGNLANMVGGNGAKKFTGNVEMSLSTDLRGFDDEAKTSAASLFIRPRYRLTDQYTMIGTVWIDKGLSQFSEDTLRDTRVGIVKRPTSLSNIAKGLLIAPNITATLPTSEMSARNQELRLGLEINPTFIYQANSLMTLIYTPRMRRNFHQFTTSRTDVVNVEYSAMQIFALAYSMADKWTFQPAFIYGQTWSYEGTQRDPIFMSILEVNYQIDRSKYVTFGTLTNGSLYEAERGPDRNIELYDENATSVYANVGILF